MILTFIQLIVNHKKQVLLATSCDFKSFGFNFLSPKKQKLLLRIQRYFPSFLPSCQSLFSTSPLHVHTRPVDWPCGKSFHIVDVSKSSGLSNDRRYYTSDISRIVKGSRICHNVRNIEVLQGTTSMCRNVLQGIADVPEIPVLQRWSSEGT